MTEQPPPSPEANKIVYYRPLRTLLPLNITRKIDALCEQRVSAETERCAALVERIADPEDDSPEGNAAADAFNASPRRDMTQRLVSWSAEVAKAIRAPAERPAPPQQPEATAPENRRVLVFGDHGEGKHDEMAMGWKDRMDGRWYYSPQGGQILWRVLTWMPVPEPSSLASTGEQPDKEEDSGKGSV